MSDSGSGNTGGAWRSGGAANFQPHAFDPLLQPELFRGVLTRRVFAFLIDLVVLRFRSFWLTCSSPCSA